MIKDSKKTQRSKLQSVISRQRIKLNNLRQKKRGLKLLFFHSDLVNTPANDISTYPVHTLAIYINTRVLKSVYYNQTKGLNF